ncbi:hypothetical protein BaRGS_00034881 [Batillaria attramentaria]|uniref:Uncharacterized protein n=1 Tax=Batillaria attramentaria TaxID=370345 RepID=A0ABD0JG83_9CAEN
MLFSATFPRSFNHFTYPVMQARLRLAAMHLNASAGCEQATSLLHKVNCSGKSADFGLQREIQLAKAVKCSHCRDYISELYEVVLLRLTFPGYKKAREAQSNNTQGLPELLVSW